MAFTSNPTRVFRDARLTPEGLARACACMFSRSGVA
jgi:hypothetical protein